MNISVNILLAIDSINRTTVDSSPTSGDVQVSTGVRNLMLRSSDYLIVNLKINAKIVNFIGGRRQVAMAA